MSASGSGDRRAAMSGGGGRQDGASGGTGAAGASRVRAARIEKLRALRDRGVEPFAYSWGVTRHAAPSVSAFERAEGLDKNAEPHGMWQERGTWAGRMTGFRSHGKSAFADLEDHTGRVQVHFRLGALGPELYSLLDLIDLGDWIGVEGKLFRTRTGQVTVAASDLRLLSKSLRPLPLGKVEVDSATGARTTHSGFADTETRYRQRYADLAVNPEVRNVFRTRARIIAAARAFLDDLGFVEVETPVLQPVYGGASARPFVTRHNALDQTLYLRIADELYLKRLIVGGMNRVYEIAKDFRNEGIDRFHNPEFTMLEFYEAFADYEDMMDRVERLMAAMAAAAQDEPTATAAHADSSGPTAAAAHADSSDSSGDSSGPAAAGARADSAAAAGPSPRTVVWQGAELDFAAPFARVSFVDSLAGALGADPMAAPLEDLRDRARRLGADDLAGAGRGKLMDKLFGALVQPSLVQPTFVLDHPRELSPLAKPRRGAPHLSERFELFVAGEEMANAFSELNDPIAQRRRLEDQAALRAAGDDEAQVVDEDYIRALEYGLPPTGGVGIGMDRVTMMLTDQPSIRDVICFPTLRRSE